MTRITAMAPVLATFMRYGIGDVFSPAVNATKCNPWLRRRFEYMPRCLSSFQ
jgi:hypothetical protein